MPVRPAAPGQQRQQPGEERPGRAGQAVAEVMTQGYAGQPFVEQSRSALVGDEQAVQDQRSEPDTRDGVPSPRFRALPLWVTKRPTGADRPRAAETDGGAR
ncbi:hypothetical protein [Micromonospora sp. NPDC049102]|uniref:hypothetical protein n=1 Tax=Micromonospora sp. NPDC049102 TaxID=3364265 RepID=UPI00371ECD74